MAWCGVEEPLRSNEHLYAFDESTGETILAEFSIEGLCRYSFTKLEPAELPVLVDGILAQSAGESDWLCVVRKREPFDGAGNKILRFLLEKSHFTIGEDCDAAFLGIGKYSGCSVEGLFPLGIQEHVKKHATFAVLCREGSSDLFRESLMSHQYLFFARRRFAPSVNFLNELRDANARLLYAARDYLERDCLVVVGQKLDINRLAEVVDLNRVEWNEDACRVWREL